MVSITLFGRVEDNSIVVLPVSTKISDQLETKISDQLEEDNFLPENRWVGTQRLESTARNH